MQYIAIVKQYDCLLALRCTQLLHIRRHAGETATAVNAPAQKINGEEIAMNVRGLQQRQMHLTSGSRSSEQHSEEGKDKG